MAPGEKRWRKLLRAIWRGQIRALQILLTPVVLALMLGCLVHLAANSALARHQVEAFLGDLFAGSFEITQIELGLDPRHLNLYGVTLYDPQGKEAVYVESFQAELDLLALLDGRVHILSAHAPSAHTWLVWDRRGNFNYTELFYTGPAREEDPDAPPSSFVMDIERVNVDKVTGGLRFPDFVIDVPGAEVDDFQMHLAQGELTMKAELIKIPRGSVTFSPQMFGFSPQKEGVEDPAARPPLKMELVDTVAEGWDWFGNGFRVGRLQSQAEGAAVRLTDGIMDFRAGNGFAYGALLNLQVPGPYGPLGYFTGPLLDSPFDVTMAVEGFLGPEMNAGSYISSGVDVEMSSVKLRGMEFDRGKVGLQLINRRVYLTSLDLLGYGGEVRLQEQAVGPLPTWCQAQEGPPVAPGRAWLSLLDLSYQAPLHIRGLQLGELLQDAAPALGPEAVVPASGELEVVALAHGRLADTTDPVALATLPAFHRVQLEELVLERPPEVVARPEAVLPTRRISAHGGLVFSQGQLTGEEDLVVSLDQDQLRLQDWSVDVSRGDTPVKGRLQASVGDLDRYLSRFGLEGFGGRASLSLHIDGPVLNPSIEQGLLEIDQPRVVGYAGDSARATFSLRDGWLRLGELQADGSFGTVRASGRIHLFRDSLAQISTNPRLDLSFQASPVDLGAVQRMLELELPLAGLLHIEEGRVQGSARAPQIEASVHSGPLLIADQPIKATRARVDINTQHIKVPDLAVDLGKEGRLRAQVDWVLGKDIQADLTVHSLRLSDIVALEPVGVEGSLRHLDLHVSGTLDPGLLKATGVGVPGGPAVSGGPDVLRWLTTAPLQLHGGMVLDKLSWSQMNLGQLAGSWSTVEGEHLITLAPMPYVTSKARSFFDGPLGDGSWQVRNIHPSLLNIELSIPTDEYEPYLEGRLRFQDLNGRSLATSWVHQATAATAAQRVAVRMPSWSRRVANRIKTPPSAAARQKVVDHLALHPLRPPRPSASIAAQTQQTLRAWGDMLLTGEVDVYFNRDDLSYLAEAEVDRFQVTALGRTLANAEPIKVSVNNGDLVTVESVTLGTRERYVKLEGAVTLDKEQAEPLVNLRLSGGLDLALFNLMPAVFTELQGIATVNLSVDGKVSDLKPSGTIKFSSGADQVSLRLRGLEEELILESGTIVICGRDRQQDPVVQRLCRGQRRDAVVIPERSPLQISALDGAASVWGSMGLGKDFSPGSIEAFLEARNMTYTVPGVMFVSFHMPELALTIGDLADYNTWNLRAQMDIFDGRYFQDLNIVQGVVSGLTEGRASQAEIPVLERVPLLRQMGYDLTINGRDGFEVQSSIDTVTLDLELKTNLEILKPRGVELGSDLAALRVDGTLEILTGGTITYQGGNFTVRKGDLTWEPRKGVFNPTLDLIAETEIQSVCGQLAARAEGTGTDDLGTATSQQTYDITMNVRGSLQDRLQINFDSSPFANQVDVVLLIATGCTADQITASAAGSPALELALRPFLSKVESEIGQYFEVDDLRLESDLEQIVVRVNKRFSNRFILRLTGAFGTDEAEQSLGARYFLYDNVFFDISERTEEQTGAVRLEGDLRLRVDLSRIFE